MSGDAWIWAIIIGGVLVKVLFFRDSKDMFGSLTRPETDEERRDRIWRAGERKD